VKVEGAVRAHRGMAYDMLPSCRKSEVVRERAGAFLQFTSKAVANEILQIPLHQSCPQLALHHLRPINTCWLSEGYFSS
jgi:hypothetical protein